MAEISVSGIARITREPDVKRFPSGISYNFGVCAYRRTVKEGKQGFDFFDVDIWQKDMNQALDKDLHKGRLIYIENGQLRNNQYIGTDGKDKNKISIHISSWEFLGGVTETRALPEHPQYGAKTPLIDAKAVAPVLQATLTPALEEPEFPDAPPWA